MKKTKANRGLAEQQFYNELRHHHVEAEDWVVVNWNLGNMCNYTCSYCPPVLNNGSFGWNDFETVNSFIDECIKHYAPRTVYFEFTGGEVTLWKHFVKTAKYIKDAGHDIGFISNGSRTIRWWEQNKHYFDHVCISYHPEFADPDHFLEVVKIMSGVCRTHANVMMSTDKELFDKGLKLAGRFRDEFTDLSLALQPLVIDFGNERFPYEDWQVEIMDNHYELFGSNIKILKPYKLYRGSMDMVDTVNDLWENKDAHRFIADNKNNWKGWDCWAGVEQLAIDFDGTVRRGWCLVGGDLGNIKKPEDINWPTEPVRCNKSFCHCNFDIMCKKVLPAERYEVLDDEEQILEIKGDSDANTK
jgi:organic radical activating enzyme